MHVPCTAVQANTAIHDHHGVVCTRVDFSNLVKMYSFVKCSVPYPTKDWISRNPIVLVAAFLGWTIPASIPSSVYDGDSLFGAFVAAIGTEMANWPKGPALESEFWYEGMDYQGPSVVLVGWHSLQLHIECASSLARSKLFNLSLSC